MAPSTKRKMKKVIAIVTSLAVAITAAIMIYVFWPRTTVAPEPEHPFSSSSPDTFKVDPSKKVGKGAAPLFSSDGSEVSIPSLDINTPVQASGTHKAQWNGSTMSSLTLPEPPDAAWYNETAPIGSTEGNTLIASHVDHGQGDLAPFSRLHKIEKGTPIFVRDAKGRIFTYKAESIKLYNRVEIPRDTFRVGGDPHLVLITCSGPAVGAGPQAGLGYLYNLVVTAVPDEDVEQGTKDLSEIIASGKTSGRGK